MNYGLDLPPNVILIKKRRHLTIPASRRWITAGDKY